MTEKPSTDSIESRVSAVLERVSAEALRVHRDPGEIRVMAVTKTAPAESVNRAVAAGIRLLGENRAQELLEKYGDYRLSDCEVHFIGHLQTNKVNAVIKKVSMIQSMDSLRLAREIDRCAARHNLVMPVLVELNVAREETKSGVSPEELEDLIRQTAGLSHIRIRGLMAIPPHEGEPKRKEGYFDTIHRHFIDIKAKK
jgi:pyridoxal phosphate enzyme (YggS family)